MRRTVAPRRWVALLVLALATAPGVTADFGYLKVKGGPLTANQPYGAVTIVSPFASQREGSVPLWLLVESGDFARPWLRAKHVSRLLPKVAELILYKGEELKVGPDEEGDPSIYVGPPSRPITKTDLKVVSVLPRDRDRFEKERQERRKISRTAVAHYWKALLEDAIELFVRYPLGRDHKILARMKLPRTRAGTIFKRILVEVGILLRFEDLTEERATSEQLRAKLVETLQGLGKDRWSQLTKLAFCIPEDFPLPVGDDPDPVGPRPASEDGASRTEEPAPARTEPGSAGGSKLEDAPAPEGRSESPVVEADAETATQPPAPTSTMRRPWD